MYSFDLFILEFWEELLSKYQMLAKTRPILKVYMYEKDNSWHDHSCKNYEVIVWKNWKKWWGFVDPLESWKRW